MEPFSEAELAFLDEVQSLARIATVGPDGTPHVAPVGWSVSADRETIEIGGIDLSRTKKFKDISRTGRAAVVIDDVQPPWRPRGIEIRGSAEAITQPKALIRIRPERVIPWGFEGADGPRDVRPTRHGGAERPDGDETSPAAMHAVVRQSSYDSDALATAGDRMAAFERAHTAQPGYAGSAVVDVGRGERITITLWDSEEHAATARSALLPVVRALLSPMERAPSRLLGAGAVITTDLGVATRPTRR